MRSRSQLLLAGLALVALLGAGCGGTKTTTTPTNTATATGGGGSTVDAADLEFKPKEITVKVGTTVTWKLVGAQPHTITADDKSFDSGSLQTGATYTHTFSAAGRVPYYCTLHGTPGQGMAGVVNVTA